MTAPLRVLCLTPFGPTGRGGIDRLYAYLRQSSLRLPGIDLRYAATRGRAAGPFWMATFPLMFAGLAAEFARTRPHVAHINFATGGSLPRKLAVLRLARAFGARTIVHFHGEFITEAIAAGTLPGRMFRAIAMQADRVIALGDAHAANFATIGVPRARISILPNGIPDFAGEDVVPKLQGGPFRIVFSGLLTENKGVQFLIPALARLNEMPIDWHCTVAGNGDVAAHAAMARDAGLSAQAEFTGWIDSPTMHRHMRAADVVVLPSRTEAMPLSLIEGACAGAALIATDVGNVRAIVHEGRNGLLVPRDSDAIFQALSTLATDRPRLAAMQVASRQIYLERFTLAGFAEGLRTIYAQTAATPTG